ncbi:MAG: hypothetical protein F9B45_09800 [Phycisphaera sp. RhM]|nr:hypothetical protein [Phycisphaera sp. RhM]
MKHQHRIDDNAAASMQRPTPDQPDDDPVAVLRHGIKAGLRRLNVEIDRLQATIGEGQRLAR